jgi:hypothetical protein
MTLPRHCYNCICTDVLLYVLSLELEWTEDGIVIMVYSESPFHEVAVGDGFCKSCIIILFCNFLRHFLVLGCGFNAGQKFGADTYK